MYNNFKIVVNTAAGRRRYMQFLVPQILAEDIVDRYDIWIHTNDNVDIEFFKQLAEKYPMVNLIWQPHKTLNGMRTIDDFYQYCIDPDTIYIKLDDDVIWLEPGFFEKIIKFRCDNPEYFIVSPLVINNSGSTYILQMHNKIKLDKYYNSNAGHRLLWRSGDFATELHEWFLEKYLKTNKYEELHCGTVPFALIRFSINGIVWFGQDMKNIYDDGGIIGDDEELMSCKRPTMLGKANVVYADTLITHYAFFTQREQLDGCNMLERYGEYLHRLWKTNSVLSVLDAHVQAILLDVNSRSLELNQLPKPYKEVAPLTKKRRISHIHKWLKTHVIAKFGHKYIKHILA